LDDIDDLLGTMQNVGDVTADTGDFSGVIELASDLSAVGVKTLKSLVLTVDDADARSMEVALSQPVRLTITPGDDLELVGAAQTARATLAARQRRLGGVSLPSDDRQEHGRSSDGTVLRAALIGATATIAAALIAGLVAVQTEAVSVVNASTDDRIAPEAIAGIAVGFVATPLLVWLGAALFWRNPSPSSVVVLAYRSEAPTWWERHHTEVVLGVMTNAVVGAIFFLLGLWLGGN
jgi:hypothetical protein